MTARIRNKCKLFAAEVRKLLETNAHVESCAYDYGLGASDAVLAELQAMLPGVVVSGGESFLGYIHFTRIEKTHEEGQ